MLKKMQSGGDAKETKRESHKKILHGAGRAADSAVSPLQNTPRETVLLHIMRSLASVPGNQSQIRLS